MSQNQCVFSFLSQNLMRCQISFHNRFINYTVYNDYRRKIYNALVFTIEKKKTHWFCDRPGFIFVLKLILSRFFNDILAGISFVFDSLLFRFWSILSWFQIFMIFTILRIFRRNFKHLRFFSILLYINYLWILTILNLIDFFQILGFTVFIVMIFLSIIPIIS